LILGDIDAVHQAPRQIQSHLSIIKLITLPSQTNSGSKLQYNQSVLEFL
jgi:hypothetical protein